MLTERVALTLLSCFPVPPPLHSAFVQQLSNKKVEINWLIFETYVALLHGMLQVVDTLQFLLRTKSRTAVLSRKQFFSLFRATKPPWIHGAILMLCAMLRCVLGLKHPRA